MKASHKILVGLLFLNGWALHASAENNSVQQSQPTNKHFYGKKFFNGLGIFKPYLFYYNQEEPIYSSEEVSQKPEFYGGADAMAQFISDNLKYPEAALKEEKQGRIWVEATIDKDGLIKEVKISRGLGLGCDEEALRLVKSMPRWKPGKLQNNPVKVKIKIPITFKID